MPVLSQRHIVPVLIALAAVSTACTAPTPGTPIAEPDRPATQPAEPKPATTAPAPTPAASTATAASDAPALAIEGEGLRLFDMQSGSATPLAFGQPQQQVLTALERFRGAATLAPNSDCGAGPVLIAQWTDGLSLLFQDDRFVGWGVDGRADGGLSTAVGIGTGSTRAELQEAYADVTTRATSLGTEFSGGGMDGVLDGTAPSAAITALWAGVSCVAR